MFTSRGNGRSRAENAALSEGARRQMTEVVPAFVVVSPAGREESREPDILAAHDQLRGMRSGAAVVTPDGRLLSYRADAVSAATALSAAERAVATWHAARLAIH